MPLTVPPSDGVPGESLALSVDNLPVNRHVPILEPYDFATREPADPPELRVQAVSTKASPELLPALLETIDHAGGWVLQRNMISPSILQMRVEAQGRALMDLYASLMAEGLELSRDSHVLLAERCNCAQLDREARSSIVSLRMQVLLPAEEPPLLSMWSCGTA